MRIVIVDDEENAIEIISTILNKYCCGVEIVGTALSAENGISIINELKPDLAFIDINMNDATGFDVINGISNTNTLIVFVTAHERFAVKAFKFKVFDYVLKPAGIEEIQDVLSRVRAYLTETKKQTSKSNEINVDKIVVNTLNEIIIIDPMEIVYIEADGRYCTLFMNNQKQIFVTKSLAEFELLIDTNLFFRTHHSVIVNLSFVNSIIAKDGHVICLNNMYKVPLSRRRKDEFIEKIKSSHS